MPAPSPESRPPTPRPTHRSGLLGETLVERGAITAGQLEEALAVQAGSTPRPPIGRVLVEMGLVSELELLKSLAAQFDVPFMELDPDFLSRATVDALPRGFLEEHNVLPIDAVDGWLTIAVERFTDLSLVENIRRVSGMGVIVVAADPQNIRETREAVLARRLGDARAVAADATHELDRVLEQLNVADLKLVDRLPASAGSGDAALEDEDSPVVTLVRCVIQGAVESGASDVHVEPVEEGCRIRYRVDGELAEKVRVSARLLPPVVSRIKILAGLDISERRLPQDGAIAVSLGDRSVDLRVSTMATKYGEKVVMRVADPGRFTPSLETIGLAPPMLRSLRGLVREAHGVVIVTGPTGSGKTTTLYGALAEIVDVRRNVSTVEDPVERRLEGANQFQVNPAAGFTFARALRSLLRQDPDVLMVGEVRDRETAGLVTEAALTGHLVLTTLHTNDAATAVTRLVNMGVEPYLIAASLRGVLAQRLVRRLCQHCRSDGPLDPERRDLLAGLCGGACPLDREPAAVGCPRCGGSGYAGRVGVFELLPLSEGVLGQALCGTSGGVGIGDAFADRPRLLDDGLAKVRDGLIDLEGLLSIVSRVDAPAPTPADPSLRERPRAA